MEKIYGTNQRQDGVQRVGKNKWVLYFGKYEKDGSTYEYRHTFTHKPTMNEVKQLVRDAIDAETRDKIVNRFEYNGIKVWLSEEKQRNYSSMERNDSLVYPLNVKLNEEADATPIYHTFQTREEFIEFSKSASSYIINTISDGWKEKDNVDWSVFDIQ